MNYDELVRCLRDCWDDSTGPSCDCDHCLFRDKIVDDVGYTDYTKCETAMVLAAADAIEELSRLNAEITRRELKLRMDKPRWIPVTERLPENDGKYLTIYTLGTIPPQPWIETCWFAKNLHKVDKYDFPEEKRPGFFQSDSEYGNFEVTGITHWMPLPTPPKEEHT